MIALAAIWLALGGCAFVIGQAFLKTICEPAQFRRGDWILQSLWIGLVTIEWLALLVSLAAPVTPWILFPIIGGLTLILLLLQGRHIGAVLRPLLRANIIIGGLFVVLAAGFAAAGLRPTPDTGEYHYPAIRWLAEHGIVVGVANIMTRLGYVSSVFAVNAPFDALIPGRALAVVNGFILCLIVAQIVLSLSRVGRATAQPSDWFLAAASLAILLLALVIGSVSTSTPDLSVMALTVAAAWHMLAQQHDGAKPRTLIPLIMTCGALNAKLSGLLLVAAGGLFAVIGNPIRSWVTAFAVAAVLVGPFFLASALASGCLALPSALSCLPVNWALPIATVHDLSRNLWEWSRWGAPMPPGAGPWNWVGPWLIGRSQWINAAVFWPFAVTSLAYAFVARRSPSAGERWVLALIVPSVVLVFWSAPDLRFNFALFVLPIALLVMRLAPQTLPAVKGLFQPLNICGALVVLLTAFTVVIDRHHGEMLTADRLLRPRPAPTVEVTAMTNNDLRYVMPKAGSACWRAALPCADQVLDGIVLRDAREGLDHGLMRKPPERPKP